MQSISHRARYSLNCLFICMMVSLLPSAAHGMTNQRVTAQTPPHQVKEDMILPFGPCQTWYVWQGYYSASTASHHEVADFDLVKDSRRNQFGSKNAPLVAVATGYFTKVLIKGKGWTAKITLRDGTEIWYSHLTDVTPEIRDGGTIKQGDYIGRIWDGAPGGANHLHFQVNTGNRNVPLDFGTNPARPWRYPASTSTWTAPSDGNGQWSGTKLETACTPQTGNLWSLRSTPTTGQATYPPFRYGNPGDRPVVGDWDGDGVDTPGMVRGNVWYLSNRLDGSDATMVFAYGEATDRLVVGDWDGDGIDTPGVVRGNVWYLSNRLDGSDATMVFAYGEGSDRPVVGDWDNDQHHTDTPGVVRGNVWYLSNRLDGSNATVVFAYGEGSDWPVVGDWDGDGDDTPAMVRGDRWYVSNGFGGGNADYEFVYGNPGNIPLVGHWSRITPYSGPGVLQ